MAPLEWSFLATECGYLPLRVQHTFTRHLTRSIQDNVTAIRALMNSKVVQPAPRDYMNPYGVAGRWTYTRQSIRVIRLPSLRSKLQILMFWRPIRSRILNAKPPMHGASARYNHPEHVQMLFRFPDKIPTFYCTENLNEELYLKYTTKGGIMLLQDAIWLIP